MRKIWIILGVILATIFIIGSTYISIYNRFVTLDENITASWAQIENQLQRKYDLIPNLINTVKGYAKHEKEIFTYVADARAKLLGAKTIQEKITASKEIESALARLLAIAENYPQLKANENFIRLQDELAGTENRIANERRRYNEIVKNYNILVKSFPSNIVAKLSGFREKNIYFEIKQEAKENIKIDFED
ncbi:MAG: LemA family protein [Endomicrobiia bacterium]